MYYGEDVGTAFALCAQVSLELGAQGWSMLQLQDAFGCSNPHHVSHRTDNRDLVRTVACKYLQTVCDIHVYEGRTCIIWYFAKVYLRK